MLKLYDTINYCIVNMYSQKYLRAFGTGLAIEINQKLKIPP